MYVQCMSYIPTYILIYRDHLIKCPSFYTADFTQTSSLIHRPLALYSTRSLLLCKGPPYSTRSLLLCKGPPYSARYLLLYNGPPIIYKVPPTLQAPPYSTRVPPLPSTPTTNRNQAVHGTGPSKHVQCSVATGQLAPQLFLWFAVVFGVGSVNVRDWNHRANGCKWREEEV